MRHTQADQQADQQADHEQDLAYTDFNTDKAKDEAFMKHEDKARQVAQKAKAQGVELGGVEFFEHKSRREILGEHLTSYTPAMFALNSSASKRIDNPRRYYAKKGIGKQTFFAKTVERDSTRFLSENDDMTNHAVALDNYDFFLKHNDEIRTNLARTMLAKLDLDMDMKKTLEDLLNGKEWKEASGEEVFHELKNRMRMRGQELNDRYMPIFKLLSKAERIDGQYKTFKQERLKAQNTVYERMEQKNDPFNRLHEEDEVRKERIKTLFDALKLSLSGSYDSIGDTLEKLRESEKGKPKGAEANELLSLIGHDRNFISQTAHGFMKEIGRSERELERFREIHTKSMEDATQAVEKWAYESKEYPIAMLSALADREYFLKHGTKEEYKDILNSMEKEFSKILPAGTDTRAFMQDFIKSLKQKRELFEHIYDPSKDTFNPQRQYMPFESVREHDTAGNILRDTLYMQLIKHKDEALFNEYYDRETQEDIVSIPLDKEINEKKPRMDEVIDTYNSIMAVEKMTTGELSNKEASILFSSPLFQDSTVLNKEEVEGLREFGSDLAEHTKVLKSRKIVGTPAEEELKNSIQEMHYLSYSKHLIDKLRPDEKEKNPIKKAGAFLNRNLFQNNKALYQLEECMKTALNPTTGVETIPSLSKGCIEKLKDSYDREAQELSQNTNQSRGWLAVSFVGFIDQMMPVLAKSKRDAIHNMIDELNKKIAEDSIYTNNARNDYERMARMMNVQNDQGRLAHHIVDSSHASEFKDEIEKEGIVKSLMKEQQPPHSLVFSDIYKTAVMPDSYQANRAEALKEEMEKLKHDYWSLREELVQKALKDKAFKSIAREIERIELDNDLIKQRLESNHLLEKGEEEQLRKMLEAGKASLTQKRDEIYNFAIDSGRYESIADSIDRTFRKTGEAMSELQRMEAVSEAAHRNRVEHNKEKHRTEIDLRDLKGKELLSALAMVNTVKEEIDGKILAGIKSGEAKSKEIERLRKDRAKATQSMEMLHKQAMLDRELLSEALAESLSKTYNIGINKELLTKEWRKDGLSSIGINHIIEQSSELAGNQKRLIRSNLYDINTAYRELRSGRQVESRYTNVVSSMLGSIQNSRLFDALKDSNDTYVAIDNIGDGKSHIKSAKSELGYYINYIDELEMRIETSLSEEEKSLYREELSDIIQKGEDMHDQNGINFGEYRDIAIKQAHSGNDLDRVNTAVQRRSTEIHRNMER